MSVIFPHPGVDAQALLDHLSDGHDGGLLRGVAEPHADLVALVPHRDDGAVDVLAVVVEGLPDEAEHHLQPEVVQAPHPLLFVQVDEPPEICLMIRRKWSSTCM